MLEIGVDVDRGISVNYLADGLNERRCGASEGFDEALLSGGSNNFMNRNSALFNLEACVSLNLRRQLKDRVPDGARQDATVVNRGDEFVSAVAILDNKESIKHRHLLNEIIETPEDIIEAVQLRITNVGHERTEVSAQSILTVAQRPVLVDTIRALDGKPLLAQLRGTSNGKQSCLFWRADSHYGVHRNMAEACIKLSRTLLSAFGEPVLLVMHPGAHTIVQLFGVKERHVEMIRRIEELEKMLVRAERLRLTCFTVLYDIKSLVT